MPVSTPTHTHIDCGLCDFIYSWQTWHLKSFLKGSIDPRKPFIVVWPNQQYRFNTHNQASGHTSHPRITLPTPIHSHSVATIESMIKAFSLLMISDGLTQSHLALISGQTQKTHLFDIQIQTMSSLDSRIVCHEKMCKLNLIWVILGFSQKFLLRGIGKSSSAIACQQAFMLARWMYDYECSKLRWTHSFSQSFSSSSQKAIRRSLSPSHPSSFTSFLSSKYRLLSFCHFQHTHLIPPVGSEVLHRLWCMLIESSPWCSLTHTNTLPLCMRRNTLRQCSWRCSAGGAVANSRHTGADKASRFSKPIQNCIVL